MINNGQNLVNVVDERPLSSMFTKNVYLKPLTSLIAPPNAKDYLSCSGMTPTVVENNLQRAIEKENEIDPEDQDGDLVITRVQSKLRKLFFEYFFFRKYKFLFMIHDECSFSQKN